MTKPRVAILGLGIMGLGMAQRLAAANFPLAVYNRNPQKMKLVSGALATITPREAAERSDIILTMVSDDNASRELWLGKDGAMSGSSPASVLIESSTVGVAWVKELAAAAANHGCELLDAPVTGSKQQAASGELVFLVGGPESALLRATPVLSILGRDIIHFGRNGSGALMKLVNNFMSGVQAASLAEAISLIGAGGLDHSKALSVLTNGAPGSPLVKLLSARAASADFTPNFVLRLMAKDLEYVIRESIQYGISLETPNAALAVFKHAIAAGYGDKDFSAVIEAAERTTGHSHSNGKPD